MHGVLVTLLDLNGQILKDMKVICNISRHTEIMQFICNQSSGKYNDFEYEISVTWYEF